MTLQRRLLLTVIALVGASLTSSVSASSNHLASIQQALLSYLNYDICWGGGTPNASPLRFGESATILLSRDESEFKFFLWTDGLQQPIGKDHDHITQIFYGMFSGADAGIANVTSYNPSRMSRLSWVREETARFSSKDVEQFTIKIPSNCAMSFPPSREKAEMLEAIINTMNAVVSQVNRQGYSHYALPAPAIVANFNVDYPRTFVYIKETGEIYAVVLHDATNYFDNSFLTGKSYPFNVIGKYGVDNALVQKIIKYGSPIEITGKVKLQKSEKTKGSR